MLTAQNGLGNKLFNYRYIFKNELILFSIPGIIYIEKIIFKKDE